MSGDAYFSPCRTWRYSLSRETGSEGGVVAFVGLNPSTADEMRDDPTIRRCIRFARDWGYARLKMVNLFAYRATAPRNLFAAARDGIDIVGPQNAHVLSLTFGGADLIVAAWGAPAPLTTDRVVQFMSNEGAGWQFHVLGLTKFGSPRHPLYMPADSSPFAYDPLEPLMAIAAESEDSE